MPINWGKKRYPIPYHETWDVHDATKLKEYQNCPRKYFFQFVLGWVPLDSNINLVFGEAWHRAMAALLQGKDVNEAHTDFLSYYREHFPEAEDPFHAPKNPQVALTALEQYEEFWREEDKNLQTIATEVAGIIFINRKPLRKLHFRMDGVVEIPNRGIIVLEHKTTSLGLGEAWRGQWELAIQPNLYSYALYSWLAATGRDTNKYWGLEVNATSFGKKRQDGSSLISFGRVPIHGSKTSLLDFITTANKWMERIEADFNLLRKSKGEEEVMKCFPKNGNACFQYFRLCEYHPYCSAWKNLISQQHRMPTEFRVKQWDPRKLGERSKEVVKLEEKR